MPFNQALVGLIEPGDTRWRSASGTEKAAFYREAGQLAVARLRGQLARGIGANGRRMKARKHPRPDGADGPVMTPHDAASRTRRLLDFRATGAGVTLFWHSGIRKGTTKPWATILGYHAEGKGHLPIRDVRLSRRNLAALRQDLAKWWASRPKKPAKPAGDSAPTIVQSRRAKKKLSRAQEAIASRYSGLRKYFRPKGEGI